jgi:hypothetical protein
MGIRLLIMAASLAATIGGWAILAAGQLRDTLAAAQQPPAIVQPASAATQDRLRSVNPPTALRQVTQPSALARTRSSR